MRKWAVAICALSLASLMLVPSMIFIPNVAGSGSNPTPWHFGDTWAIGSEVDLFEDMGHLISEFEDNLSRESGFRDVDLGMKGVVGFYHTGEVAEPTHPEFYTITTESAAYIHTHFNIALEAQLPKAGTYGENGNEPRMSWIEMDYQQSSNLVLRVKTTQSFTRDDWELQQVDTEIMLGWREAAKGHNLPYIDYDFSGDSYDETMTIKYYDMNTKASASITAGLNILFEPALRVFNFPLTPNDSWEDTATSTVTGYLYGDMDMTRPSIISDGELDLVMESLNEGLAEMGSTKRVHDWDDIFPLHVPSNWMIPTQFDPYEDDELEELFENVTIVDDRFVFNPVTSEPMTYRFSTGDMTQVTMPDGSVVPVMEYEMLDAEELGARGYDEYDEYDDDPQTTQYVGTDGRTLKMDMIVTDPNGDEQEYAIDPVTTTQAMAQMNAKADTADPAKGGFPLTDEEDPFPWMLALVMVAVVVAVAASGRFVIHHRKDSQMTAESQAAAAASPQQLAYGSYQQPVQAQYQAQAGQYQPQQPDYAAYYPPQQQPVYDPYANYRPPATYTPPPPTTQPPAATVVNCPNCSGQFQVVDPMAVVACPHCGTQGRIGG